MRQLSFAFLLGMFFLCNISIVSGQNEEKIWVYGDHRGLNFTSGSPVSFASNINTREGAASVCDAAGNLLFYSNGNKVWSGNTSVMPNGTGILGNTSMGSCSQGVAIVRSVANTNQYYLFTLDQEEAVVSGIPGYLRYSVIDMSLNGGQGDVLPSQKNIVLDSFMSEQMTVAKTAGCAGYWLVVRAYNTGSYKAFKIDATGIHLPVVSAGSGNTITYDSEPGEIKISPDGSRIAFAAQFSLLMEMGAFNNATGAISNVLSFTTINPQFYGCSFSPDGTKLYASNLAYMQQFDATLYPNMTSLVASSVMLTTFNGGIHYWAMRIGPDQKIYVLTDIGGACITVINNPNVSGTGCNMSLCAIPQPINSDFEITFGSSIVINNNPPQVTINPTKDTSICKDAIILVAPPLGNYLWNTGATGQSLTVNTAGTYWVTSGSGCSTSVDTFRVKMLNNVPDHILGNDTTLCEGGSLVLDASTPGCAYAWQDASTSPTYTVSQAGTYFVRITKDGCTSTDTIAVSIANDYLSIAGADTTVCMGQTVTLSALTSIEQAKWSNGSTATDIKVTAPGTYLLTATTPCGTFADSVIIGMVDCSCPAMVPTAFSPNDDGVNDVFLIQNNCTLVSYGLYIYNRYGQEVFYSNDINRSWDGRYKGQKCELGAYFYYLKYKNPAGTSFERKGDLSLVR